MSQAKSTVVAAETTCWAPLPAALTGAVSSPESACPPAPVVDDGRVHLGAQTPLFLPEAIADAGLVRAGAQTPLFLPEIIADAGLVRLGAQSPIF